MAINQALKPISMTASFASLADDPRLIIYDSLTTSDRSADSPLTGVLNNGTTADYNENGMYNGGDGWIKWSPSTAQAAALQENAHIHFEIESTIQANTGAGDNRIITSNIGGIRTLLDNGGNIVSRWSGGTLTPSNYMLDSPRPAKYDVFDIIVTSGSCLTFVNGLLVGNETRVVTANTFTSINLFASQLGGAGTWSWNERIKNLYVLSHTPSMLHKFDLSNIQIHGDSLLQQGNLPAGLPDSNGVVGTYHADLAATAAIHRGLASAGIKSVVLNKAISGDKLADVQTLITAANPYEYTGKIVLVDIGINDAKSGTLTTGFSSNYQTLINDILAFNPAKIFVCTLTSTAEDSTYPYATSIPAILQANTAIRAAAESSALVHEIDLYTFSGGANYIVSDYRPADLHWSAQGSNKFGKYIIDNIIRVMR